MGDLIMGEFTKGEFTMGDIAMGDLASGVRVTLALLLCTRGLLDKL